MLADWAAIAIANARLYRDRARAPGRARAHDPRPGDHDRGRRALGGVTDLDRVLELVVKRSRALIDARAAEIALLDGDEFVIAAVAGQGVDGLKGHRMPVAESLAASAMRTGRQQRFDRVPPESFAARELGARAGIATPMIFRNRPIGFLVVIDRLERRPAVQRGGRAAAAGVRGERGDRRGDGAERRATRRCGAGSRPPRPSAPAGRASCTTRRCSSSPACACCSRARAQRRARAHDRRDRERARADHHRDRRPALADHRAAAGRAGRARRQARARGAGRARVQPARPTSRSSSPTRTATRRRGTRPRSSRRSTGSCRRR